MKANDKISQKIKLKKDLTYDKLERLRDSIHEVPHLINRRCRHGTKLWAEEIVKEIIQEYFPKLKVANLQIERAQQVPGTVT